MAGNYGAIVVFDAEMSYTLEEHMAIGEEAGQQRIHHVALSDEGLADLVPELIDKAAGESDALRERLDVGTARGAVAVHGHFGRNGCVFHDVH